MSQIIVTVHGWIHGQLCNGDGRQGIAELMEGWSSAGTVVTDGSEARMYNPSCKRGILETGINFDDTFKFYRSTPISKGSSGLESAPYSKAMGSDEDMADRAGNNQDGPNLVLIRKGLAG